MEPFIFFKLTGLQITTVDPNTCLTDNVFCMTAALPCRKKENNKGVSMGFTSGVMSLTATDFGKQAAKSAFGSLFGAPFRALESWGVESIFGTAESEKLSKILEKLDELDKVIKSGFTEITMVVEEEHLSDAVSYIESNYQNLVDTLNSKPDLQAAFSAVCKNYYNTEVTTEVAAAAGIIRNNLCAGNGISNIYPKAVAEFLYQRSADIYEFNNRMTDVSCRYGYTITQAMLVLTAVAIAGEDETIRDNAAQRVEALRKYGLAIQQSLDTFFRDIPEIISRNDASKFVIRNKATDKVMGRYAQLKAKDSRHHCHFELKPKGDGYYYLKISDKDIGIDHYYGEEIKPVGSGDSGHPNHLWRFEAAGRWFKVINKATGKSLDHYYGRSIKSANADEHPNHLWEILPSEDGNHCTITNKATGALLGYDSEHKRIDAFGGEFMVNAGVYNPALSLPSGWDSNHWHIRTQMHDEANNVTFHNLINVKTGDAVDYYDGEDFRFTEAPSGHPNHLWKIEPTSIDLGTKAYYFVRNKATGTAIDHYYGKELKGASDSNTQEKHSNHLWLFEKI